MTNADQTPAGADIVPAGPAPDLRTRMTEAAKDAFADDVRPDGARLFTDERQRHPWRALDGALAAAWGVVAPELAAIDRLRERITELADEWEARAARYLAWRDHHHDRGDETTARISRVRADMCTRHVERLRALLEAL